MARGLNKVLLIGHAGSDAEMRYTTNGTAICTFTLATSESWTDKQTNEKQERTEWHRIKIFGRLGEIANEYLKKGRQVYIEGSIRTDKFTGKDGVEKYFTDIIASEMQLLGANDAGGSGQQGSSRPQSRDNGCRTTSSRPQQGQRQQSAPAGRNDQRHGDSSFGDMPADDEIPFDFRGRGTLY